MNYCHTVRDRERERERRSSSGICWEHAVSTCTPRLKMESPQRSIHVPVVVLAEHVDALGCRDSCRAAAENSVQGMSSCAFKKKKKENAETKLICLFLFVLFSLLQECRLI